MNRNNKGFTLIEMMIVMIIISLLVLVIIPNATTILDSANKKGCEAIRHTERAAEIASEITDVKIEVDKGEHCKEQ